METNFSGYRFANSYKEADIDKDHQKFNCKPRNLQVSWSRCIDNYVGATAFGEIRGPKQDEKWDHNCFRCIVGKELRRKFAGKLIQSEKEEKTINNE